MSSTDDFAGLVAELQQMHQEILAKSEKADADDADDDTRIQAAADGDADDDGELDGEDMPGDDDEPDGDEDDLLGKSFVVELNGEQVEAVDGTALVKSLQTEISGLRAVQTSELGQMREAISSAAALIKSLQADNARLTERLNALASSGGGRKSVLRVHERPVAGDDLRKSDPAPVGGADLMRKALEAQRAGRLSGTDVARLDAYLGRGLEVPEPLRRQILG